ncbi:tetratricopeptide repeat protein [Leptospira interrogans str. 2003000735]|uniref:Tetratricopeptide repeat protein n=2 Tax=Leptospira interrogans TaxID=173 RepID=A0A829D708_LEPIR|nr:tetratricopeptide repeat protein [Leptospira interrogans]EMY06217.1 tetratricopeptide repeat protein [Leptospira interrogans str. 2002000626]EMY24009.1 tetratricopeptide repeat protein [Leptospira interrogans serovar Australis str. 200703203]EKN90005.1 tetratricopeptide repeat protein [Leptospira interrogans str. 2002000624]EKQ39193.1 tetratricopeptide repeat protein [Leptospira interrogans str. 2002000621]EKQ49440.1 tetratricopeptide repeat protein [Leptospira interrogans str. 2002000623]
MKQIRIFKYFVILIGLSLTASLYAIELDPGGNRIEEGLEYYNQGEYLESLKKYQEAESYFPEDSRLEFNRGTAEFKSGNIDKAIRHFEKSADSTSPEVQWKSRFNLGNSYMRVGDRKKAAEEYIKALKLNPNLKEARKNLEYLRKTPPPSQNSDPQNSNSKKEDRSKNQTNSFSGKKQKNGQNEKENANGSPNKEERLTKEETERILDSLDLNKIRRKSGRTKDREVFW